MADHIGSLPQRTFVKIFRRIKDLILKYVMDLLYKYLGTWRKIITEMSFSLQTHCQPKQRIW